MYCTRAVQLARMVYGTPSYQLPVIILHGILGNKMNWRSIALKLANETGRQVNCLYIASLSDYNVPFLICTLIFFWFFLSCSVVCIVFESLYVLLEYIVRVITRICTAVGHVF